MMFAALPSGFPRIEAFTRSADATIPAVPTDLTSMGEKVYRACINTAEEELPSLRSSIQRRIPYAMWLDSQRDINTREDVVSWYYAKFDDSFIDGTSRTKRALTPLLHTYAARYDSSKKTFLRLASNLRGIAKQCVTRDLQVLRLSSLHKQFDFFNPDSVGTAVARAYFANTNSLTIDRWFESIGLWGGFKSSALGLHIYRSALLLPTATFRDNRCARALMSWAKDLGTGVSAEVKALLAEALLKPWLSEDPSPDLKREIRDFCVDILEDPRFNAFSWNRVDSAAKRVIDRWLTERTLEVFFQVLRHTADEIWEHRQDFWTWYYRKGHITEAWAVLGPDAHRYVVRNHAGTDLAYGRLDGQASDAQSVLLMRMGDMLFCEWSHNGKLRAISIDSPQAPKLYQKPYQASRLRFQSLPFLSRTGHVHEDGLPHLHSESGWWQSTAAYFISSKLGVRR